MKQVELVEKGLQTLDGHNDRATDFLTSIFQYPPQRARPGDLIGRTCVMAVRRMNEDKLIACRIQGIEFQDDLKDHYPRKLTLVLSGCPLCGTDGLYRVFLQQMAQDTPLIIELMCGYTVLAFRILD